MRGLRFSLVWLVLASWLVVSGCDESTPGGGGSRFLSTGDLVGTWTRVDEYGTDTFRLDANGTTSGCDGEPDCQSRWSIDDGMLVLSIEESGEVEGCTYNEYERWGETAAVIDEVLYSDVYVRTSGSGSSLDGTWEHDLVEEGGGSLTCPGESEAGSFSGEEHITVTISGDAFELHYAARNVGEEGGERYDQSESGTGSGTYRVDGDAIYYTITVADGELLPEEEQYEELFGFRVALDIVVRSAEAVESVEELGYRR